MYIVGERAPDLVVVNKSLEWYLGDYKRLWNLDVMKNICIDVFLDFE